MTTMTRWSYVGVNLQTGAVLEALPLTGVSFTSTLSSSQGNFAGTLDLKGVAAQPGVTAQARCDALVDAVDCGRRAVYVLANGLPVWGGPVWADPDQDGDVLSLAAAEWGSYFAARVIRATVTYTAQDQLAIARSLITTAQAVTGGNVLVATGTETSGVNRTVTYTAGALPIVGEQLDQLATQANGFDYAWPVEWNGSTLRGRLKLGYPQMGLTSPTYVVKGSRGRARTISMGRDASAMATTSWAIGQAPSGTLAPVESTTDATLLTAGYPVLDKVQAYSDLSDTAALQAHSDADQQAAGGVLTSITADVPIEDTVAADVNTPALVALGDAVRFERSGRRDGANGFVATLRVTSITWSPESSVATLTLSPRITVGGRVPTVKDEAARIAHLQRVFRLLAVGT